jgi:hypothetical protein
MYGNSSLLFQTSFLKGPLFYSGNHDFKPNASETDASLEMPFGQHDNIFVPHLYALHKYHIPESEDL